MWEYEYFYMRNFKAALLFSLTFIIVLPFPVYGQLFIERYGVEQLDLDYFWAAGFSEEQIPNEYPLRQPYIDSFLNEDVFIRGANYAYGNYLKELYLTLYGTDPQIDYKTRTRRLVEHFWGEDISPSFFGRHANLYGRYDNDIRLGINPVFRFERVHDETFREKNLSLQSTGIESWVTWKNRIGAYVHFFDTVQRGMKYYRGRNDVYEPYAGYVARDKQSISYDQTTSYLGYTGPLFSARIGRGRHQWGPGVYHNLLLSEQHPPYDYFELRFHYHNMIFFTYLHAIIDPTPLEKNVLYYNNVGNPRFVKHRKYLAAHRIEFLPLHWLSIGFSEAVVYGDRNIELGYAIPVNIFWSEGHDDKYSDNILWAFDTKFRFWKGLVGYGELLLDDMAVSKFGSSSFVNKAGYLGGLRWIHPFGFSLQECQIEYTRLRPFVYTHWFEVNIPSHYGYAIGSTLPPNSDELRTSWKFHIRPDFTLDLFTIFRRHGTTFEGQDPVGGSIYETVGGKINIKEHYPFLDGKREDLREIGVQVCFRVLERMELQALWGIGKYSGNQYKRFSFGLLWNY